MGISRRELSWGHLIGFMRDKIPRVKEFYQNGSDRNRVHLSLKTPINSRCGDQFDQVWNTHCTQQIHSKCFAATCFHWELKEEVKNAIKHHPLNTAEVNNHYRMSLLLKIVRLEHWIPHCRPFTYNGENFVVIDMGSSYYIYLTEIEAVAALDPSRFEKELTSNIKNPATTQQHRHKDGADYTGDQAGPKTVCSIGVDDDAPERTIPAIGEKAFWQIGGLFHTL